MKRRLFLRSLCAAACGALIGLVPDLAPKPRRLPDVTWMCGWSSKRPNVATVTGYTREDLPEGGFVAGEKITEWEISVHDREDFDRLPDKAKTAVYALARGMEDGGHYIAAW